MQFVADKDLLLKTVLRALAIMDADHELPVFQTIRVDVFDSHAVFSSSAPGISCAIRMPLKSCSECGTTNLPAKRVLDVIKVLKGDVKVSENTSDLVIASGRSRFTVKKLHVPDGFESKKPEAQRQMFDAKALAQTIRKITSGVGIREDKVQTQVVHINNSHLVVTDLAYMTVSDNTHFLVGEDGINLDRKLLVSALKSLGEGGAGITIHEDRVAMTSIDASVHLNCSVLSYPAYHTVKSFIASMRPHGLVFDKTEFVSACSEVLVATGKDSVASIHLGRSSMVISSHNQDRTASSEVDCEFSGEPMQLYLNVSFVSKGVQQFTSNKVHARIIAKDKPILFYEEGYEFYANPCREP